MPIYDYQCPACGPFTELGAMASCAAHCPCPRCTESSPRVVLSAPRLALVASDRRKAMEINERSRHAPKESRRHGNGCGCCSPAKPPAATAREAVKGKPGARPWMISH